MSMSHIMSHILWFALTFIDWVETLNRFISGIKGGSPEQRGHFIKLTFEICECELRTKKHAAQLNKEIKISSI